MPRCMLCSWPKSLTPRTAKGSAITSGLPKWQHLNRGKSVLEGVGAQNGSQQFSRENANCLPGHELRLLRGLARSLP